MQIQRLKELWPKAHTMLAQNPSEWTSYAAGLNLAQISESVNMIVQWMDRVKAPKGFASTFHLGRTLVAVPLDAALSNIEHIKLGYFDQISQLISNLNSAVSGIHTMVVFSRKDDSRELIASLGGELAQSICMLDTAQKELAEKIKNLEKSSNIVEALSSSKKEAETILDSLSQSSKNVVLIEEELNDRSESMEQKFTEINKYREETKKLHDENDKIAKRLREELSIVADLRISNETLTKTVEALLPQSASAGLASAFHARVKILEWTKWAWMGAFIISILSLIIISIIFLGNISDPTHDAWKTLINKIPLITPLIWLGWFSAIQYGNAIRVQEDYAFKEATSKAFEGYRSHMSHLATVSFEDANNAMLHLATKTIDILSQEPLRVYSKPEGDASPFQSTIKSFAKRKTKDSESDS